MSGAYKLSKGSIGFEKQVQSNPLSFDNTWPGAFFSLVGHALGDAMGAPFEMRAPKDIKETWDLECDYPHHLMPCGLIYTDDTQMSLSFIESLMKHGKIEPDFIKKRWVDLSSQDWFDEAGQPLKGPFQFGGFRGTGGGFRSTVGNLKEDIDADHSTFSAGNGAAMRVVSLAIWACRESKPEQRVQALSKLVVTSATLTHHDILGVSPAYALAFLLMNWLRSSKSNPFWELDPAKQLEEVANATRQFEAEYLSTEFFLKTHKNNARNVHSYSTLLSKLVRTTSIWHSKSPETGLEAANDIIVDFSKDYAFDPKTNERRRVTSMNDGMAPCSATAAIVAGLLFRDKPLLPVLQHIYYYGNDTDSVGAMLGSLLGAYYGAKSKNIPSEVCHQLITAENVLDIFRMFIHHALKKEKAETMQFDFIRQEHLATLAILKVPNGQRNPHYNSQHTNSGTQLSQSDVYKEVLREVKKQLEPYKREEKREELKTLFSHIYCRIFLFETIKEKAHSLSGKDRKDIFTEAWTTVLVGQ